MPSFTGAYVARVNNDSPMTALIPQVFQDVNVPLDRWIGGIPQPGQQGYVIFINGEPEWPVWIGSQNITNVASGGGGGGAEEVFIGPSPPEAGFDLWYDTDAVSSGGSGGGGDDVHVGPTEPSSDYELWFDTDATAPTASYLTNGWLQYSATASGTGGAWTNATLTTTASVPAGVYTYSNNFNYSFSGNFWAYIWFGAADGLTPMELSRGFTGTTILSAHLQREKYHAGGPMTLGISYGFSTGTAYQILNGQLSYRWSRPT